MTTSAPAPRKPFGHGAAQLAGAADDDRDLVVQREERGQEFSRSSCYPQSAVFYLHLDPARRSTPTQGRPERDHEHRISEFVRAVSVRRHLFIRRQTASSRRQMREAARSGSSRARGRRSGWHRPRAVECRVRCARVATPCPGMDDTVRASPHARARAPRSSRLRRSCRRLDRVRAIARAVESGMSYGSSNGSRTVELDVSRRRDAGGVRDRREADVARAQRRDHLPVEREARRRRLEGNRRAGNRRPHIPEGERHRHVRVLNGPAVAARFPTRSRRTSRRSAERSGARVPERPSPSPTADRARACRPARASAAAGDLRFCV